MLKLAPISKKPNCRSPVAATAKCAFEPVIYETLWFPSDFFLIRVSAFRLYLNLKSLKPNTQRDWHKGIPLASTIHILSELPNKWGKPVSCTNCILCVFSLSRWDDRLSVVFLWFEYATYSCTRKQWFFLSKALFLSVKIWLPSFSGLVSNFDSIRYLNV